MFSQQVSSYFVLSRFVPRSRWLILSLSWFLPEALVDSYLFQYSFISNTSHLISMGIERNDLTDWVRVDLVRNDRGFETTFNQWAWNIYTLNPYQDSSFVRMYFPVNFIIADIEAKRFKSVLVKSFYNQLLETKKKLHVLLKRSR